MEENIFLFLVFIPYIYTILKVDFVWNEVHPALLGQMGG